MAACRAAKRGSIPLLGPFFNKINKMTIKILKEFIESKLGVKITNRTKFVWFVLFSLFIWVLSAMGGYLINDVLEERSKISNVTGIFGQFNKDTSGYYFPLYIINTGQKPIDNIGIRARTCFSKYYFVQTISALPTGAQQELQFRDHVTEDLASKKACQSGIGSVNATCIIKTYILNNKTTYAPPQNCSVYVCGPCNYTINLKSNTIEKKVYGTLLLPREIVLQITPQKEYTLVNYTEYAPIGLQFVSDRELCIWDGTCKVDAGVTSLSFLDKKTWSMSMKPTKPYSEISLNISVLETN